MGKPDSGACDYCGIGFPFRNYETRALSIREALQTRAVALLICPERGRGNCSIVNNSEMFALSDTNVAEVWTPDPAAPSRLRRVAGLFY